MTLQDYTSGDLLTGFLKKELIDLITPIILDIQEKKRKISEEVVFEYMRPRRLKWTRKDEPSPKVEGASEPETWDRLNELLADQSYLNGHKMGSEDISMAHSLPEEALSRSLRPHLARWARHVRARAEEDKRRANGMS